VKRESVRSLRTFDYSFLGLLFATLVTLFFVFKIIEITFGAKPILSRVNLAATIAVFSVVVGHHFILGLSAHITAVSLGVVPILAILNSTLPIASRRPEYNVTKFHFFLAFSVLFVDFFLSMLFLGGFNWLVFVDKLHELSKKSKTVDEIIAITRRRHHRRWIIWTWRIRVLWSRTSVRFGMVLNWIVGIKRILWRDCVGITVSIGWNSLIIFINCSRRKRLWLSVNFRTKSWRLRVGYVFDSVPIFCIFHVLG